MSIQNFEEVIQLLKPHLSDYLTDQGIDISGHFTCLHPDHNDSTPSCHIVGKDSDSPRCWCQGCSKYFDIFDAVHYLEGKSRSGLDWVENTLRYLAEKYGVELAHEELTEEQLYTMDVYKAYKAAAQLLSAVNLPDNATLQEELKRRKWKPDALSVQGVGTISSYSDFRSSLRAQGFTTQFLDEIELGRKDIFHPDCLIFSWKDHHGTVIGFTCRDMKYEEKKKEAEAAGKTLKTGKYNNIRTTGLRVNIFKKKERLYGIDQIDVSKPVYIFEGQADVITARLNGFTNSVAISGSELRDDHIQLLKKIGVYDIIICLDGDDTGRKKLGIALDKLAGNRDMKIRVIEMPDGADPDSFITEKGKKAFRDLAKWSAFEWRLNKYDEQHDEGEICREMMPYMVSESSPVVRDQLCKQLAKRTGISYPAITAELDLLLNAKAHSKSRERVELLDQAMYQLRNSPSEAEVILQKTQAALSELVKKHDSDTLSHEDFVRAIDQQKLHEEQDTIQNSGFKLGKDLKEVEDIFRGNWDEGVFIGIGGKPNVGKSSFLCKLGYAIAENNEDVTVLYHTIDDTAEQLTPRFVTIAEGSRHLSINMVRQPKYWSENFKIEGLIDRREVGYKAVRYLAQEGRLVVKDLNHGNSLPFIENLISYYQHKFPERKLVYILDNFHKLRDNGSQGNGDERVRFKAQSEAMKSISIRRRCCIITSMEYTKLAPGIKPTNNNIAESGQMEYDASALIHLYSDLTENPGSFQFCHEDIDWKGEKIFLPRVEFIVGKNKISEQKRSFFLDFWPAASDYKFVDQNTVLADAEKMKNVHKQNKNGDEVEEIY